MDGNPGTGETSRRSVEPETATRSNPLEIAHQECLLTLHPELLTFILLCLTWQRRNQA
jgi:hypothetical protein